MKNFKFIWKNFDTIKQGYDLATLTIEIQDDEINPTITFSTGDKFAFTVIDKTFKENNKEMLEKLSKVKIAEENIASDGCDGDAWEIEVDGKVLKGYLDRPKWLNEIKEIICFNNIFEYAESKIKSYIS